MENKTATKTISKPLLISRTFNAPVKLVWKAWTDPQHLMKWWGPKNFTSPYCKIDFRVGGKYHFCMRSSEGQEFWSTGTYREIVPFKRIVWTDSFADEKGNVIHASALGMGEDFPMELLITLTFEEINGKTKFALLHEGIPAGELTDMTNAGWNESLDKLAETLN